MAQPLVRALTFLTRVALMSISTGAGRIFIVVGGILAARILGSTEFGAFAYIQSTIALVGVVLTTGLSIMITRFAAELRTVMPTTIPRFYRIMLLSTTCCAIFISLLVIVFADRISAYLFQSTDLNSAIRVAAMSIVVSGATACSTGVLTALGLIRPMAIWTSCCALLALPLLWLLVSTAGVAGACAGVVIFHTLEAIALTAYCSRILRQASPAPGSSGHFPSPRRLLSFAFPSIIAASIGAPTIWYVNWTLAGTASGALALGVFNAALQCFAIVAFIPAAALRILLPWFTERITSGRFSEGRRIAYLLTSSHLGFGALMFLVAAPFAQQIAAIYGTEFASQSSTFLLMLAAAPVAAAGGVLGTWLNSSGQHWAGLSVSIAWAVCFVGILQFWNTPSAQDAALAMLSAYLGQVVVLVILVGMRPAREPTPAHRRIV